MQHVFHFDKLLPRNCALPTYYVILKWDWSRVSSFCEWFMIVFLHFERHDSHFREIDRGENHYYLEALSLSTDHKLWSVKVLLSKVSSIRGIRHMRLVYWLTMEYQTRSYWLWDITNIRYGNALLLIYLQMDNRFYCFSFVS